MSALGCPSSLLTAPPPPLLLSAGCGVATVTQRQKPGDTRAPGRTSVLTQGSVLVGKGKFAKNPKAIGHVVVG